MVARRIDVYQTRSNYLRTNVKPSTLFSSTARQQFLIAFHLYMLLSHPLQPWRTASLSRGDRGLLVIRRMVFPQLEDNSRPLKGQGAYGGLVILASHALLAIKGLRPLGVLDGLPGTRVERVAETCGAKPPEVRHGHFAAPLRDRSNAGEGQ
jgi:hypothetical protein